MVLHSAARMFDVIVVGGGPAGLSAGLMLGRCRRRVLVCDFGQPRNRRSRALHGYLTRDGIEPPELNDLGRRELATYDVEFRCVGVTGAHREPTHFRVALANGAEEQARYLLIATGVVDDLPAIPGFEECYGRSIFHCPYCDGWECRDRRIAAFGSGRDVTGLALGLRAWTRDVIVCSHGTRLDRQSRERLARNGLDIRGQRIAAVDHRDGERQSAIRDPHSTINPQSAVRDPQFVDVRSAALTVLAVLATILVLQYAQSMIIPIVLALLVSYALEPIVATLARWRIL